MRKISEQKKTETTHPNLWDAEECSNKWKYLESIKTSKKKPNFTSQETRKRRTKPKVIGGRKYQLLEWKINKRGQKKKTLKKISIKPR